MTQEKKISIKTHSPNLTRSTLRDIYQIQLNLGLKTSKILIESILKNLVDLIIAHDHVKISSFGTFLIHKKKERLGRNPKTKVPAKITARKSVSFRPSSCLRQSVNFQDN